MCATRPVLTALFIVLGGCGGGTNDGSNTETDGRTPIPILDGSIPNGRDGSVVDAGPIADGGSVVIPTDAGPWVCYLTTCNDKLLQCGNCLDDDNDGLVDSQDPECLGPCDNTEGAALNAGVGGETGATCGADCYWDFGNGPGNDMCVWDYRCDPFAPKEGCPYTPDRVGTSSCATTQPEGCQDFCSPLTPNGCDCFGCCTFPELTGRAPDGTDLYVWIGAVTNGGTGTCTFADVEDPTKCPVCTPQPSCLNDCQECELCIGKPELPSQCYTQDAGPAPQQCPVGVTACGLPGQAPCGPGLYCISGCCQATVD